MVQRQSINGRKQLSSSNAMVCGCAETAKSRVFGALGGLERRLQRLREKRRFVFSRILPVM